MTTNDIIKRDIEQGKELLRRVKKALDGLDRFDGFKQDIVEEEIKFRFDAIEGMLLMARNDIEGMINMWESEIKEVHPCQN